MHFLVLSHAPPEFAIEVAIWIPEMIMPISSPATDFGPNKIPKMIGMKMTSVPGKII